jgi:hypothetical protein
MKATGAGALVFSANSRAEQSAEEPRLVLVLPASTSFQVGELLVGRFVAAPRQKLTKHFSNRVERRVVEERPGCRFKPGVRCAGNLFVEALHQTRFADARLAYDQNYQAFTVEDAFPTVHQRA